MSRGDTRELSNYTYRKEPDTPWEIAWKIFKFLFMYPLMAVSFLIMAGFWMTWWWMYPPWQHMLLTPTMWLVYIIGFVSAPLWQLLQLWVGEMKDSKLVAGIFMLAVYGFCAYELGVRAVVWPF